MIADAKDAPPTKRTHAPPAQRPLRLLHALLLVGLGAWLLARALQTLLPDVRWAAIPPFAATDSVPFAAAALLLGAALMVSALTLPNGHAWAWAGAAACALAAFALLLAAWMMSGASDWLGILAALLAVLVLAAPSARELYLN